MGSPFDIVKDSSIWCNAGAMQATFHQDTALYTGTVKDVKNDVESGEPRYLVEIQGRNTPVACRMMSRLGGLFNYEDVLLRGYDYKSPATVPAKTGDVVLVGMLGGQGREGVILGGLMHPGHKTSLKRENGPEYRSEFNGVETYVNKDGEYSVTFKAQPTNLADLNKSPNGILPTPQYDTDVGGGFFKWDKTGSFTINDAAKEKPQLMWIDKLNGNVQLASGDVVLRLDKTNNNAILTSPDIRLGSESVTEQAVLGTTYRAKESTMNDNLKSELDNMQTALNDASTQLNLAAADPVLVGLAPAAAQGILQAAVKVLNAATQAGLMSKDISSFEASKKDYLSDVVKVG